MASTIAIFTVYKQFFRYLNLPTTEQKNSLFRQPINLWLALMTIGDVTDSIAIDSNTSLLNFQLTKIDHLTLKKRQVQNTGHCFTNTENILNIHKS